MSLLLIYFVACVACFWDWRLGWLTGMFCVSVVLTQQLWANLAMAGEVVRGTEPNPLGTIMLIAVNSTLLIAPATVICLGYFINRRQLAKVLMPPRTS